MAKKKIKQTKTSTREKGSTLQDRQRTAKARELAKHLVDFVDAGIRLSAFGDRPKSPFTTQVIGDENPNMLKTGELLSHIKTRKVSVGAYRVYWDEKPLRGHRRKWNARNLIEFYRKQHQYSNRTSKGKKRLQWLAIKAAEKGLTLQDLKQYGRRKGFVTFKKYDFWDKAVDKFIRAYSGKNGITIIRGNFDVIIRVA